MTSLSRKLMLATALGLILGLSPSEAAIGNQSAQTSNNPSGLGDLLRQARQAMSQGHPNVAVIYLKNAAMLAPKNADVHLELGYAYMRSGNAPAAVRELRTARSTGAPDARVLPLLYDAMLAHHEGQELLDQFPAPSAKDRSPFAATTLRARAIALDATGHPDQAIQSLDTALSISRDIPSLVARARLAKDQRDMTTAMKLSDEAYAKAPNDQSVLLLRISMLQSTNRAGEAVAVADNLVKRYPWTPMSQLARAGVYLQLNQDAKARADVDAILNKWKNLPEALYLKAMLLERAKDTKGAWMVAQTLPPEFTGSRQEVGIMVARMAAAAGHADLAMNILAGTVSRFPNLPDPRILLASEYLREKNGQRALDTLLPMRDSQDARVMLLLGQTYSLLNQSGKATEYFDKATSAPVGGELLKRQLAASNLRKGDYDTAIKQLRELYAKQPSDQVNAGLLITALVRSGDIAGAGTIANQFAAAAPKSAYGPLYQGQIQIAKKDFQSAIAAFNRAAALDPKFVLAYYDRAIARAGSGDYAAAEHDLGTVLQIDPKNIMAMVRAAEFSLRQGNETQAESYLKRAVATDPANATPNLALSSYYISRKRMKEAGATIGAYLKRAPNDANAQMVQAEIQLAGGQVDPALATFKRLAAQNPQSPQAQLMLASAFAAKKDNKSALTAYQRSVQLAPKFPLARSALVRFAMETNNSDLALKTAMDGTKQDPGAPSDILLATTLASLQKMDQAESVMKQGLAQHPSATSAVLYSQLVRQKGNGPKADQVLKEWIAKHPTDTGPRLELGQQYMQSRPDFAIGQFRAVLKTDPKNMVALNNLSWLLQKTNTKEALGYAEEAAKLAPQSAAVLDTLGWVKWLSKDAQGALPILQKAHASDPNNAEIAYHLAVVLDGTGRKAEAKKTLAGAIASNQAFAERADAMALNVRLR